MNLQVDLLPSNAQASGAEVQAKSTRDMDQASSAAPKGKQVSVELSYILHLVVIGDHCLQLLFETRTCVPAAFDVMHARRGVRS